MFYVCCELIKAHNKQFGQVNEIIQKIVQWNKGLADNFKTFVKNLEMGSFKMATL